MPTPSVRHFMGGSFRVALSLVALGFGGIAPAQTDPAAFIVSPEICMAIAENAKFRVIDLTWNPGNCRCAGSAPRPARWPVAGAA